MYCENKFFNNLKNRYQCCYGKYFEKCGLHNVSYKVKFSLKVHPPTKHHILCLSMFLKKTVLEKLVSNIHFLHYEFLK